MADIRTSSMGGIPKGQTSDRPSNPSIGDVFYNGTLGCLDIYTAQGWVANSAPPAIPTIGTVTYSATNKPYNNSSASIAFTPGEGGGLPNSYRATSTPGGYTGTATTSPITVEGLQSGVSYTFSVTGTNNFGTSAGSINSSAITANTVPQIPGTPVATYASNTSATLTFTAGATGGSAITNYEYSLDGTNYTALSPAQTSSPLTISGLTALGTYSFYIKAVNANGKSLPSLVSNSVTLSSVVTGGTLASDSTYYYRLFKSTGNLVVTQGSLTADVLVVAGGGGSGYAANVPGGGGAGGVSYHAGRTIPVGTITATIGGAGSPGANGGNSVFDTITSNGGGYGASESNQNANSGGSGGGGTYDRSAGGASTQTNTGGAIGYGNAGGSGGSSGGAYPAGGGGGAGAAGQNGQNGTAGGAGGNGLNTWSSWLSAITSSMSDVSGWSTATSTGYIAGGGGGGSWTGSTTSSVGGFGGGGHGGANISGQDLSTNGVTNTGGGAGGSFGTGAAAGYRSGGSGLIIVRYAKSQVAAG